MTLVLLCLAAGFANGASAAPPLPEDEEESLTIERELRARRRPLPPLPPAPLPPQENAPAVKLSGTYGISVARVSDSERTATLPFAIQWDLNGGGSSFAVESDGLTWSRQGSSSVSVMSDLDFWIRLTPPNSTLSAKFGITVGSRGAVGNNFDRVFAHLYQKVSLDPQHTAMFVAGVRQRINHRQQDPGATGELIAELSRKLASGSAVHSAFLRLTHIKPQARSGNTRIRLGADIGAASGMLTLAATRKLSQGGGTTALTVDWIREF